MTPGTLRPLLLACALLCACTPDVDGDGFAADVDCNDANASVHPGADELCNTVDDDCDGTIDEDPVDAPARYTDADGDGYGSLLVTPATCEAAAGSVDNADDCDDTREDVFPGAPEVCHDGAVNDCATTEPPDCPLSGPIPTSIAIARRPIDRVDYAGLELVKGSEDGVPQVVVGSQAMGGTVGMGTVLEGPATANGASTQILDQAGCVVADTDLDGLDELLCRRPDEGMFVVQAPLPEGTIEVPRTQDSAPGMFGGVDRRHIGQQVIALRDGRDGIGTHFFTLPLNPGQRPAWTLVPRPGEVHAGVSYVPGREEDTWMVPLSIGPSGALGAGVEVYETTPDGPRRLLRVQWTLDDNILAPQFFPLTEHRPQLVLLSGFPGHLLYVFPPDAEGDWTPHDPRVEVWEIAKEDRPGGLNDYDGDGAWDLMETERGYVRLPIRDRDFTPFAWTEPRTGPLLDLQFHDLDDDGHPEWIFINKGLGEDGKMNGITVLPGNWP